MAAKGPDFQPGDTLPGTRYRVVRQIGAGGMGVVYQVVKPPEIQGVLKLMSSELTGHEEFRTRFLDEVRVLAQIDHPNIVKVFDYDKLPDGTPFYVMELLHGRTVRDVLATMGTFPPRVAFEVTRQLCEALHCAHTHDIPVIHRDIKPENIFLHAPRHGEPVVKLIDFGVVAVADRQHDGVFVGTWKYAAPEQIRGERATPATDLYAVGLVLYEMLCGIGPFEHLDSGSLVSQAHLREIPPPVSKFAPWVPPSVVELIAAALAKEPRQRPRSAHAFAERLYDLEWASDGKDPNERTTEGPLSRILSTAGGADKPSSKHPVAAPPRDRLGNVPVIGVPAEARHGGPTMKGVGGHTHEPTSPGEDALLAGLVGRPDIVPRSKKARDSGPELDAAGNLVRRPSHHDGAAEGAPPPSSRASHSPRPPRGEMAKVEVPTLDAPPSAPKVAVAADTSADFSEGSTRKLPRFLAGAGGAAGAGAGDAAGAGGAGGAGGAAGDRTYESDTLGAQESDAERAPRRTGKLALPIALALFALIGVVSFLAYRVRTPAETAAAAAGDPRAHLAATATAGDNASANANATAAANATAEGDNANANAAAEGGGEAAPPVAKAAANATGANATGAANAASAKVPAAGTRGAKGAPVSTRVVTPAPSASAPGSMRTAAPAPSPPEVPKKPAPAAPSKDESFLRGL
jgi:serine/threonine protein kinase